MVDANNVVQFTIDGEEEMSQVQVLEKKLELIQQRREEYFQLINQLDEYAKYIERTLPVLREMESHTMEDEEEKYDSPPITTIGDHQIDDSTVFVPSDIQKSTYPIIDDFQQNDEYLNPNQHIQYTRQLFTLADIVNNNNNNVTEEVPAIEEVQSDDTEEEEEEEPEEESIADQYVPETSNRKKRSRSTNIIYWRDNEYMTIGDVSSYSGIKEPLKAVSKYMKRRKTKEQPFILVGVEHLPEMKKLNPGITGAYFQNIKMPNGDTDRMLRLYSVEFVEYLKGLKTNKRKRRRVSLKQTGNEE
jgi:hypothetical protein